MTKANLEILILKMLKLNHDTPERNVVLFHPKMLLHSGVTSNFVKGIFCNFVKCGYFLPKQLWSTSSSFSHVWWIFYFWNSNIFSDFKVISKKKVFNCFINIYFACCWKLFPLQFKCFGTEILLMRPTRFPSAVETNVERSLGFTTIQDFT